MHLFETQTTHYDDPYVELQSAAVQMDIEEAHQIATGRGVSIAIIDSAVDASHPDLRGRVRLARNLVDVGRALDPDNDDLFTWWAPWRNMRQRNIGWRLDYVLASAPLAADAVSCPVQREVGTSDHAPVVATFEVAGPS